jgi:hypothetical protein
MPAMGPDYEYARKKAKEASAEVLELLVKKYGIASPCKGPWFEDFVAARDKIEGGIEELFIADANDSF